MAMKGEREREREGGMGKFCEDGMDEESGGDLFVYKF